MKKETLQKKLQEYENQKNTLYAQLFYIPEAREILQNIQAVNGAIQVTEQFIKEFKESDNG